MKTEQEQIEELLASLLAHQPLIDATYDQLNSIAIALIKIGYGDVHEYKAYIAQLEYDLADNSHLNDLMLADIEKLKAENEKRLTCDFVKNAQKQAQIDVLNKAKEKFNAISRELGDECDLCGVSAVCSCRCEIDKLIKEMQAE